jgi:hypothetical protein
VPCPISPPSDSPLASPELPRVPPPFRGAVSLVTVHPSPVPCSPDLLWISGDGIGGREPVADDGGLSSELLGGPEAHGLSSTPHVHTPGRHPLPPRSNPPKASTSLIPHQKAMITEFQPHRRLCQPIQTHFPVTIVTECRGILHHDPPACVLGPQWTGGHHGFMAQPLTIGQRLYWPRRRERCHISIDFDSAVFRAHALLLRRSFTYVTSNSPYNNKSGVRWRKKPLEREFAKKRAEKNSSARRHPT